MYSFVRHNIFDLYCIMCMGATTHNTLYYVYGYYYVYSTTFFFICMNIPQIV